MREKRKENEKKKSHNARCGKGGFTLVELCIVLALIAIMTGMTVTFSALVNKHANDSAIAYSFLEDSARLKDVLCDWTAEKDKSGASFVVTSDEKLALVDGAETIIVSFSDGVLSIGDKKFENLDAIQNVSFDSNEGLIRCIITRFEKNGKGSETRFVFAPRAAKIDGLTVGAK